MAEKIRARIFSEEYFSNAQPLSVSASVGAVQWQASETFEQGLHRADELLYQAKGMGRNCTVTDRQPSINNL